MEPEFRKPNSRYLILFIADLYNNSFLLIKNNIEVVLNNLDYTVFMRDAENEVALGISRVQKALVFEIMALVKAKDGEHYKFPFSLNLIK